jgi:hypothetical protein
LALLDASRPWLKSGSSKLLTLFGMGDRRFFPPSELIVIPLASRGSPLGLATQREAAAVHDRMMRVGPRYHEMVRALEVITKMLQLKTTRAPLEDFANSLIKERGLPPLDRLARRKKQALICWFCENCPDVMLNPRSYLLNRPVSGDPIQRWCKGLPDYGIVSK